MLPPALRRSRAPIGPSHEPRLSSTKGGKPVTDGGTAGADGASVRPPSAKLTRGGGQPRGVTVCGLESSKSSLGEGRAPRGLAAGVSPVSRRLSSTRGEPESVAGRSSLGILKRGAPVVGDGTSLRRTRGDSLEGGSGRRKRPESPGGSLGESSFLGRGPKDTRCGAREAGLRQSSWGLLGWDTDLDLAAGVALDSLVVGPYPC